MRRKKQNKTKKATLKQNNLRQGGETAGLGTGKGRCFPIPGAFPARGRLRQAGASGVADGAWSPGGRLGGRRWASLSVIPLAI